MPADLNGCSSTAGSRLHRGGTRLTPRLRALLSCVKTAALRRRHRRATSSLGTAASPISRRGHCLRRLKWVVIAVATEQALDINNNPSTLHVCPQDLAAFLLVRGPYAAFGYGWTGCADATHPFTRPPALEADYGVPNGFCEETSPGSGVFARDWSLATVTLDCNGFNATIAMK